MRPGVVHRRTRQLAQHPSPDWTHHPRCSKSPPPAPRKPPTSHFTQADLFTWTQDRRYPFVFFGFWLSHVPPERFAEILVDHGLRPYTGRPRDVHRRRPPHNRELIDGPDSSTIERRLRDGRRFRAVKVPLEPASLERSLQELGWNIEVTATRRPVLPRPRPPRRDSRCRRSARPRNGRWSDTHHKHNFSGGSYEDTRTVDARLRADANG